VYFAASLASLLTAVCHGQEASSSGRTTNAMDKATCEKQLNMIYEAIQEYQKAKHDLPNWLSDLVPEFLYDSRILTCPFIQKTGDARSSRKGILDIVFSDQYTSYSFEFCRSNLPPHQWGG